MNSSGGNIPPIDSQMVVCLHSLTLYGMSSVCLMHLSSYFVFVIYFADVSTVPQPVSSSSSVEFPTSARIHLTASSVLLSGEGKWRR